MKKIELSQGIGILANVGVIAGIVLLVLELRQSNLLMQSQARMTRLELRQSANAELFESPHLHAAFLKWIQADALSAGEEDLIRRYWNNRFLNFNAIYEEYQNGLIPEYQLQREALRSVMKGPAFEYWAGVRGELNPEFVGWAEELLESD